MILLACGMGDLSVLFLTSDCATVGLFSACQNRGEKKEYRVKEKPSYGLFLISQRASLASASWSVLHGPGARRLAFLERPHSA